jgi:hypothetical protein
MEPSLSRPTPADAAPVLRRTAAWAIDSVIVLVPAALLIVVAVTSLVHALPGYLGSVAAEVGWSRLATVILHHGHGAAGVGAEASEEWFSFVLPLFAALLAVPLIHFLYHGGLLAWRGRTLGSIVADIRVGTVADPMGLLRSYALRRAFLTALVESGLLSFALAMFTIGQFTAGSVFIAVAVAAFWLNMLILAGPRRRTLVDRLTGTVVVRTSLYADLAARTVTAARVATGLPSAPEPPTFETPTIRPAVVDGPSVGGPSVGGPSVGGPSVGGPSVGGSPAGGASVVGGPSAVGAPSAVGGPAPLVGSETMGMGPAWAPGTSLPVPYSRVDNSPAPIGKGGPTAAAAASAARMTADAAAVAAQLARERAEAIARSASVQQALNSRTGQRAQALGVRASGSARDLGGRAQEIWKERQRRRSPEAEPPAPGPKP